MFIYLHPYLSLEREVYGMDIKTGLNKLIELIVSMKNKNVQRVNWKIESDCSLHIGPMMPFPFGVVKTVTIEIIYLEKPNEKEYNRIFNDDDSDDDFVDSWGEDR
jgi:hypothetical protein